MSYHDALAQIIDGPDDPDADALYEAERERRREDRPDEAEPDEGDLYEAEMERRREAAADASADDPLSDRPTCTNC